MTTDASAHLDALSGKPARLRRRADFVRAAKTGARVSTPLFTVQMARQTATGEAAARFGFTVTRKIAGAVGRNRIRRRLKEALRVAGSTLGSTLGARPGRDYVFVARRAALDAPFTDLITQIAEGFARLNDRGAADPRRKRKDRPAAP